MRSRAYPLLSCVLAALALVTAMAISTAAAFAQGGCQPIVTVDMPAANATLQGPTTIGGWAIDRSVATGNQSGQMWRTRRLTGPPSP